MKDARQRLEFIAHSLEVAAANEQPAWGALLALQKAVPLLLNLEPGWRDESRELLRAISRDAYRTAVVLTEAVGDQIATDAIFFGLMSMSIALENAGASHMDDRASYARVLMCRLSVLIEEQAIADRGFLLVREATRRAALIGVVSPSHAMH